MGIVRGTPQNKKDKLEHYLYKDMKKNKVHAVPSHHKQAKKAILEYRTLGNEEQLSLLSVQLHTGRSHQIRVQLATMGCPLYGDQKYGQHVNRPGQQIALWAHTLSFPHPTKKEVLEFKSYPPNEYPWMLFDQIQEK